MGLVEEIGFLFWVWGECQGWYVYSFIVFSFKILWQLDICGIQDIFFGLYVGFGRYLISCCWSLFS